MLQQAENLLKEFINYVHDEKNQRDILSLYLVVDPTDPKNQATNPAWRIRVKNAVSGIESGLSSEALPRWEKVKARLDNYMATYRPTGKTLVLFVGAEAEIGVELPVRLEYSAHYGWPQMMDFLWAIDEYEQYLVVLLAQDQARGVQEFLGETVDDVTVHVDQTWQRKERKTAHKEQYDQRQDEFDRRFLQYIAGELNRYFLEDHDLERIILGGNVSMSHALRNYLHPSIADSVISVMNIPYNAETHDIAEMIRGVAKQYERENEVAVVTDIINRAKSGGRGALGLEDVENALDMQLVSLLILPYPIEARIADGLIMKAVNSSSDIEFVKGEAAETLNEVGGIAAKLYYVI